jgi:hypothetical protein
VAAGVLVERAAQVEVETLEIRLKRELPTRVVVVVETQVIPQQAAQVALAL